MELSTSTKRLYWLTLPVIAALTCAALGPYVGIPTALVIAAAAICAGITGSRSIFVALLIFSAAYAGDSWADMQGQLQVARAKQAELQVCANDKAGAFDTARSGAKRYRQWRETEAKAAYQACVSDTAARYPNAISEIDPRNEVLASARIAAKAGKELATAILVELTASTWGAVLIPVLGIGMLRRREETETTREGPRAAPKTSVRAKDPKRVAAGKKAAATRKARRAKREMLRIAR